ncbi:hypothetical protein BSKO_08302 [Bryopsis sp. KO-2023]|nr:hypothetical protein BSKO_08302 [Bryopsis sp. KO-2023]
MDIEMPQNSKGELPYWSWKRIGRAMADGWNYVDSRLADFFGLNTPKYQWAIDEYLYQRQLDALEGGLQENQQSQLAVPHVGAMGELEEQRMERDGDREKQPLSVVTTV